MQADQLDPIGEQIRQFFLGLTPEWKSFPTAALARHERLGLFLLCSAALMELSFKGTAWTDEATVEFEATTRGVWLDIDRVSLLPDAVRRAVPAWRGRAVAAQIGPEIRARLTAFGAENMASVRRDHPPIPLPGGPPWTAGEMFLTFLLTNPVKGKVGVRIIGDRPGAPGTVRRDQTISRELLDVLRDMADYQRDMASALKEPKPGPQPPATAPAGHLRMEDVRAAYPDLDDRQIDNVRKRLEAWRDEHEDECLMGDENPETGRRRYSYPAHIVARFVREVSRRKRGPGRR